MVLNYIYFSYPYEKEGLGKFKISGGGNRVKIAIISKTYIALEYQKTLAELVNLNNEILLIEPKKWGNYKEEEDIKRINIVKCDIAMSGKNHFFFYKEDFKRYIKDFKADVIKIHEEPWSYVTFQSLLKLKDIKVCKICFTWQNIHKNYPYPFRFFENFTYKNVAAIQCGNTETMEILRRKSFNGMVEVIPEIGVDEEIFKRNNVLKLKEKLHVKDKIVIGYVGRLVYEKGVYDLLKVFGELIYKYKSVHLIFIGAGDKKDMILKWVNDYGLKDKFTHIGWVKTSEMPNYMNLLDIMVLPSFEVRGNFWKGWKEQFGRVLIEAMSCEVAVLGSSCGAIPEVIGDGGLVFKEKDLIDMKEKLKILIEDGELRRNLGKLGRERVLENFTHKKVAQKTLEFYKRCVHENFI